VRIQKPDVFAMPLQYSGKFIIDQYQSCKSAVKQLAWGSGFLERTKQLGKAIIKTAQFQDVEIDTWARVRDAMASLDSISPRSEAGFGQYYDSLKVIQHDLTGVLGSSYGARDICVMGDDDIDILNGPNISDAVLLNHFFSNSQSNAFYTSTVDAKQFNKLAGDALRYNLVVSRIKTLTSSIERDLSATRLAIASINDIFGRIRTLRNSWDSLVSNVVTKKSLFPMANGESNKAECSVRSPLLAEHERIAQSGKTSGTVRGSVQVSSQYALAGLPVSSTCTPAIYASYDTTVSEAELQRYIASTKQALTSLWDSWSALTDPGINPVAADVFRKVLQSYSRIAPGTLAEAPGLDVSIIDVSSFGVFGKSDQQLQPYHKQLTGLITKIVDGYRTQKYEAAEEYVKVMRAKEPLNAEELIGDDDDVAERAIGSLFMLYVGALEGQKNTIDDILFDANADELVADLFDISEGGIDDVFDDVVESKKIAQIGIAHRLMRRSATMSGKSGELVDDLLAECEQTAKKTIATYENAIAYLMTLKEVCKVLAVDGAKLAAILNSVQSETTINTHTNVPMVASDDLCSVLQEYNLSRGTSSKWGKQSNQLVHAVVQYLDENEGLFQSVSNSEYAPEFHGYNPVTQCWQFSWLLPEATFSDCEHVTQSVIVGYGASAKGCTRKSIFITATYDRSVDNTEEEGGAEDGDYEGD